MSIVKKYFYNIECDVCGCICDDELWTDSQGIKAIADESGWINLGDKDYCPDCWKYDENNNIITSDGKGGIAKLMKKLSNNYDDKNRG